TTAGPDRFGLTFKDGKPALYDRLLPLDAGDEDEEGVASSGDGPLETRTDAGGRFHFERLPSSGKKTVLVTAPGFAERLLLLDPQTTNTITLEKVTPLKGRVTRDGRPIAGALVFAYAAGTLEALAKTNLIVERAR